MFTLHSDKGSFRTLINQISMNYNILPEIIEKDYFVTLMLKEIAFKQEQFEVFFKGGTALYKALKSIHRFSEDIDLTFNDTSFSTKSSKKAALKRVTSEYTSLPLNKNDVESISGSKSRTSVYTYSTMFEVETFKDDRLNRIGKLKIETTSFTKSSPVTTYKIEPIIYTCADSKQKLLLSENYKIMPFDIKCISIERIFIDKLFAIEDYFLGSQFNRLIEVSKHLYDIHQLYLQPKIRKALKNPSTLRLIIKIKEEEQEERIEAKTRGKTIIEFEYFNHLNHEDIRMNFDKMQDIYIFASKHFVDFDIVISSLNKIYIELQTYYQQP